MNVASHVAGHSKTVMKGQVNVSQAEFERIALAQVKELWTNCKRKRLPLPAARCVPVSFLPSLATFFPHLSPCLPRCQRHSDKSCTGRPKPGVLGAGVKVRGGSVT